VGGMGDPAERQAGGQTPRARRAPLVHAVLCRFAGQAEFVAVTTLNISESGMLVAGPPLPAIGTTLEFRFLLESGFELLAGTGTVMRHGHETPASSAGIAFGDMESHRLRILRRIVEVHAESEAA